MPTGSVHGKFTYGKMVTGTATIKLYDSSSRYMNNYNYRTGVRTQTTRKPIATQVVDLDGTGPQDFFFPLLTDKKDQKVTATSSGSSGGSVTLPAMMLSPVRCMGRGCMPFPGCGYGKTFSIDVEIKEGATSEVQSNDLNSITFKEFAFNAALTTTRKSYIPGLPMHGALKLTKLDGSPAITMPNSKDPVVSVIEVSSGAYNAKTTQTLPCKMVAGHCTFAFDVPAEMTADFNAARVNSIDFKLVSPSVNGYCKYTI